jgi:hypothetical protein
MPVSKEEREELDGLRTAVEGITAHLEANPINKALTDLRAEITTLVTTANEQSRSAIQSEMFTALNGLQENLLSQLKSQMDAVRQSSEAAIARHATGLTPEMQQAIIIGVMSAMGNPLPEIEQPPLSEDERQRSLELAKLRWPGYATYDLHPEKDEIVAINGKAQRCSWNCRRVLREADLAKAKAKAG